MLYMWFFTKKKMKKKSKKSIQSLYSKYHSLFQKHSIKKKHLLDQHQHLAKLAVEFRKNRKSLQLKPLSAKHILSMYQDENLFKSELQELCLLLNEYLRQLVKLEESTLKCKHLLEDNHSLHPSDHDKITFSDILISNPFLLHKSSKF